MPVVSETGRDPLAETEAGERLCKAGRVDEVNGVEVSRGRDRAHWQPGFELAIGIMVSHPHAEGFEFSPRPVSGIGVEDDFDEHVTIFLDKQPP